MNSTPADILLEVFLDGQLLQTIRLDPVASPAGQASDSAAGKTNVADPVPERQIRSASVSLPPSGPVRLTLDLRRSGGNYLSSDSGRTAVTYDGRGRLTNVTFPPPNRTTYVFDAPDKHIDREPPEEPDEPPDEPHIVE
jgi:YD repeat-containing protein